MQKKDQSLNDKNDKEEKYSIKEFPSNKMSVEELERAKDWAEKAAERAIEKFPEMEVYTCAAGISPSGVVHFGNFRDLITAFSVFEALKAKGKKARMLFSWDDYDRFRKVPKGISSEYKEYIGMPLTEVPDPEGEFSSFAERFEAEFEKALKDLGMEVEIKRQTELYKSGAYKEAIIHAVKKRIEIAEILYGSMSKKARMEKYPDAEKFIEEYYPITVYSSFTGKDNTKVLSFDGEHTIKYLCEDTGKEEEIDLRDTERVKLSWKTDWPMRWRHEGVVFEPGGKDHSTPGGSYDVSSLIARKIFGIEPPVFVGYDFVGLSGLGGKMSSSMGNAISPGDLLEIYTPELLKYVYSSTPPHRTFNLSFGTVIYKQYSDLDESEGNTDAIPFKYAVAYGQIVNWDFEKLKEVLKQNELEYSDESIRERLPRAKKWLEKYNPEEMIVMGEEKNTDYYESLTEEEKKEIKELVEYIKASDCDDVSEINLKVYEIPKVEGNDDKQNKAAQKRFFKNIYQLLFSQNRGPRLATYIWAVEKTDLIKLLDF